MPIFLKKFWGERYARLRLGMRMPHPPTPPPEEGADKMAPKGGADKMAPEEGARGLTAFFGILRPHKGGSE